MLSENICTVHGAISLHYAWFETGKTRDGRESIATEWRKDDVCGAAVELAGVNIRVAITDGMCQATELLQAIVTRCIDRLLSRDI